MDFFFNDPDAVVDDTLAGLARFAPITLTARDSAFRIAVDAHWEPDASRVAVISGGGAGHEPSHAGFVGAGMLTAAVSGDLFTSPSVEAVLAAIRAVTGPAGALLVIKNYTGDRLNFGLAAERARGEGYAVDTVLVADDISLPERVAPRGLAGTVLVHKIAGHVAATGASLADVHEAAQAAAGAMASIGLSLSSATLPGSQRAARSPELGLGIHNEPGVREVAPNDARDAVSLALAPLLAHVAAGDTPDGPWALLVNNMGGCSTQEMSVLLDAVVEQIGADRVEIVVAPSPLMSSMNMHGFSLTLLALNTARREGLLSDVAAAGWPGAYVLRESETLELDHPAPETDVGVRSPAIEDRIAAVCQALITDRARLDDLDAASGDGDTGTAFARGAKAIETARSQARLSSGEPARLAGEIGDLLAREMGGSSGVLLSILATAAGNALAEGENLAAALKAGAARMQHHGGASPGDRTLLDALLPAIEALAEHGTGRDGWARAARAAADGAQATADMTHAGAGRAAYVRADALAGQVDPGAAAIACVFGALAEPGGSIN